MSWNAPTRSWASWCHPSQHVGGFVITKDRLDEIVPIVKTAMPERKMVEWDKDDLDAVGILKVDILALGMLSCLRRAFDLLKDHYDARNDDGDPIVDFSTMPKERPEVLRDDQRADTLGRSRSSRARRCPCCRGCGLASFTMIS